MSIGITISAVAVLLMSWPSAAVSRKSPSSSAYGPASLTIRTSSSASVSAAPVSTMAVESEINAADQNDGCPRDASINLLNREHAQQHHSAPGEYAGDRCGHKAGGEEDHHPNEHANGPLRARSEGNGLAADVLRRVDDEHIRIGEVPVQGIPSPLEQERVARRQRGLLRPHVLALPLHS
jgi:hypothetical protein